MMRLSLATKIFFGFALVVCTFGAVSAYSVVTLHRAGAGVRVVSQGYLPLTTVATEVSTLHKERMRELQRLLEQKDGASQRTLLDDARAYDRQYLRRKLQAGRSIAQAVMPSTAGSDHAFLSDIERRLQDLGTHHDAFDARVDELLALLGQQPPPDPAAVGQKARELLAAQQQLDGEIKQLQTALDTRISLRVADASAEERRGAWTIIVLTVCAILLGLLVTMASLRVLSPVRRLTELAVRVGRGDYSAQAPVGGGDEIAVLAREFNAMALSLREREAQLAQKQQELVRAERLAAMGRVTAQITHEIRNPLSSIGLNAEMLEDAIAAAKFDSESEARESVDLLRAIAREVDRLTEITEEYLRFARAPKPQLLPEDLNAVTGALLDFLQPELAGARVEVERALCSGPLWATADEGQLRQALLNLLRNAREALAGKGGHIRVRSGPAGDRVALSVEDDGPGIRPDDVARIFDPFFSTKERGTGLGLSVTQQIIREHGGEIACDSAPGRGTRFTITLPRASAPRAAPAGTTT